MFSVQARTVVSVSGETIRKYYTPMQHGAIGSNNGAQLCAIYDLVGCISTFAGFYGAFPVIPQVPNTPRLDFFVPHDLCVVRSATFAYWNSISLSQLNPLVNGVALSTSAGVRGLEGLFAHLAVTQRSSNEIQQSSLHCWGQRRFLTQSATIVSALSSFVSYEALYPCIPNSVLSTNYTGVVDVSLLV